MANLNIEATYAAITGHYAEFPSLCFVDTLDNVSGLGIRRGHQHDLLAALSDENVERVKRQNGAKISVIIGNPPYNANQQNENDDNKNREYPHVDRLIKQTYVAASKAQKTKMYDMYTRFFRWASDRLGDDGIIAFITNNSFAKKANYDGFRKLAAEQFCDIYVIDFKGDARTSGEPRRREGDNIFENAIKVGVAISFMVRKSATKGCTVHYAAVPDYAKLEVKRTFVAGKRLDAIPFEAVTPDSSHNWVGLSEASWDAFPPIASKITRAVAVEGQARAIFKTYALGVSTNRDEWLYDMDGGDLTAKVKALIAAYDAVPKAATDYPATLKWSETLKRHLTRDRREAFDQRLVRKANYRPFVPRWLYQSDLFIDRGAVLDTFFPLGEANRAICFSDVGSRTGACVLAIDEPADLHFNAAIDAYQQVGRHRFAKTGERLDNVTDWALRLFEKMYGKNGALDPGRRDVGETEDAPEKGPTKGGRSARKLTKDGIFHYIYAVLHDPVYRERYALNLRREFPRIPFYPDFWRWADWGERLMAVHIGYEGVEPWPLERVDTLPKSPGLFPPPPAVLLRPDKAAGAIRIDGETTLAGVPPEAWEYQLGNRSGLEWILEQHKERRPKDPIIAGAHDTYRFADHKERVIDLIRRVTRVSVETARISGEMKQAAR